MQTNEAASETSHFFPQGLKKRGTLSPRPAIKRPETASDKTSTEAALEIAELLPWNNPHIQRGIALASRHNVHTLIVGETGTGKELVAQEIHERRRKRLGLTLDAPFIAVNCGAIPEALAESMLFGHERGAFTSARDRQYGRFEVAKQGTLFLDEIQSLPLQIQVKLLRVLQTGELERLGSKTPVKIECQVVTASNIPLELLIDRKMFRRDLYFRLNSCPIYLPALRDRRSEIPKLVELMLKRIRARHRTTATRLSPEALELLLCHNWPGNLRELEHSLTFACLQTHEDTLEAHMFPESITGALNAFIQNGQWMLM